MPLQSSSYGNDSSISLTVKKPSIINKQIESDEEHHSLYRIISIMKKVYPLVKSKYISISILVQAKTTSRQPVRAFSAY